MCVCQAIIFLYERVEANVGAHLIVNSHYPTDYLEGLQAYVPSAGRNVRILDLLRRTDVQITYIGAHRHSTDDNPKHRNNIAPNREWVVGGGGGWSCDGPQGVVVGDVDTTTGEVLHTRIIQAEWKTCCRDNPNVGRRRMAYLNQTVDPQKPSMVYDPRRRAFVVNPNRR